MLPKSAISHEGYNKIVVLDEEYAYIQPKTEEAIEKLRPEMDVLGMVSDRVDIRLVPLASQGRQDVPQSGAEVVFPVVSKSREIQEMPVRLLASGHEIMNFYRCVTGGHPMPVDRRLRIAGA